VALIAAGLVNGAFAAYGSTKVSHHDAAAASHHHVAQTAPAMTASTWTDHVRFGGAASVAFNHIKQSYDMTANNVTTASSHSISDFRLNDANLTMDAAVSPAVDARLRVLYLNNTALSSVQGLAPMALGLRTSSDNLTLDQAYVTFHNVVDVPVHVTLGKGYVPFGHDADPTSATPSITQMLSQINATHVAAGFSSDTGAQGSVFGFSAVDSNGVSKMNKFGVKLGFNGKASGVGYGVNASFLNDARAVYSRANPLAYFAGAALNPMAPNSVRKALYNVGLNVDAEGVDAGVSYTATAGNLVSGGQNVNAKPSVWGVTAGYSFDVDGYKSRVGGSYERAANKSAAALNAKEHWDVGYRVAVAHNVDMSVSYANYRQFRNASVSNNKTAYWLVGVRAQA